MLDIKFIRENPDTVKNACRVKNFPDVVDDILTLDVRVRELKTVTQTKTAEKNKRSEKQNHAVQYQPEQLPVSFFLQKKETENSRIQLQRYTYGEENQADLPLPGLAAVLQVKSRYQYGQYQHGGICGQIPRSAEHGGKHQQREDGQVPFAFSFTRHADGQEKQQGVEYQIIGHHRQCPGNGLRRLPAFR